MEWKVEYEVGDDKIDHQHKTLVGIINDYNKTIGDDNIDTYHSMGEVLKYLTGYTTFHFRYEEEFMAKINYPDIDRHKKIHKELVQKLRDILIKLKKKEKITPLEFYRFLVSWLNDHILGEDKKITKYFNNFDEKRVPLTQPEQHLNDIVRALDQIDKECAITDTSKSEKDLRRIIFLDFFLEKFIFIEKESFINVLKLMILLYTGKVISKEEKEKLYYNLNLDNKFKKLLQFDSGENLFNVKNYLNKVRN